MSNNAFLFIMAVASRLEPSAVMNYCSIMESSLPAGLNKLSGKTNNLAPETDLLLQSSRNSSSSSAYTYTHTQTPESPSTYTNPDLYILTPPIYNQQYQQHPSYYCIPPSRLLLLYFFLLKQYYTYIIKVHGGDAHTYITIL